MERVSTEHPSADLTQRLGDLAWRVRFREGQLADGTRPWLLQPTECQSSPDARMAEGVQEYGRRHFRALRREGALLREGEEPRVLAVVVYDGQRRWPRRGSPPGAPALLQPGGYTLLDAGAGSLEDWPTDNRVTSWARLLRARDPEALLSVLAAGVAAFPGAADRAYRKALRQWALALLETMVPDGGFAPPPELENEQGETEMTTLLEANLRKWEARVREEARLEGRSEGRSRGRAEERERVRKLVERLDAETAERVSSLLDLGD